MAAPAAGWRIFSLVVADFGTTAAAAGILLLLSSTLGGKMRADETPCGLPPSSVEAEQAALGCILLSPVENLNEAETALPMGASVFYDIRHSAIYRAMLAMRNGGKPIDPITLQQHLKDGGQLESAGGLAYLSSLPDFAPSAAGLSYYTDILREKFKLREMGSVCRYGLNAVKGIDASSTQLDLWNLRGYAADFTTLIPKIIAWTRNADYSLILLDPAYKLYGANTRENETGDVAQLLLSLESLAVKTGAAVAFGCHFAKGNAALKEAIDRISGSGVFARDPDSLLMFTRHEEQDAFTVDPILRNFKPIEPFCVRWKYPIFHRADDLDPDKLKQPKGGKPRAHDPVKLLAAIAETTAENPIAISKWAGAAGISRQTLQGYLPEMRVQGWVATAGEGSSARQFITPKGFEAVAKYQGATR